MTQDQTWLRFEQGTKADLELFLRSISPDHPIRVIIEGNHWDGEACGLLASSSAAMDFRFICLRGAPIADEGIATLAASPILSSVRTLCVERCGVSDAGVEHLARSPHLRELRELYLCNRTGVETGVPNMIGDPGALALAASPNLRNLEDLDLWNTSVGNSGVEALVVSPQLLRLSQLTTWATCLTSEGAARAKALVMEQWERHKDSTPRRTICTVHTDYDVRYSCDDGSEYG